MTVSPFTIQLNGEPRRCEPGTTIADLVAALALAGKRFAIERNQEIIPRVAHADTVLQAGDQVEIVQAIGGG